MNMINEIKKYNFDYMDNVRLFHTILTLWNYTAVDINSISEKIYNIADALSKKYPQDKYEKELIDYIDELNKKEYDIIKQRRNKNTMAAANV